MLTLLAGIVIGVVATMIARRLWRHVHLQRSAEPHNAQSVRGNQAQRLGVIELSPARLDELRQDPRIALLLLLGRMSNALRFAHTAPLEVHDEGTPRAGRQLNGAFFLQVATTQEAIDTLRGLAVHLKDLRAWQEEVVPLLRDPELRQLEREGIRDLRRKIAFHFDLEAIQTGLGQAKDTDVRLLASRGTAVKDVYFPFADEVALAFLIPTRGLSSDAYRGAVHPWLQRATQMSVRVAGAVESLIVELCKALELRATWVDDESTSGSSTQVPPDNVA